MFEEEMNNFLEQLKNKNYAPGTVKKREECLNKIFLFLAENNIFNLSDVNLEIIEKFRIELVNASYSPHTVESMLQSARVFFNYLEDNFLIFENPFRDLVIRKTKPKLGRVLTEEEITKLINSIEIHTAAGLRNRAIIEVLYSSGMRCGEFLNLKVRDIDLKKGFVKVFGKGRKERVIPIGKHSVKALEAYLGGGRQELMDKSDVKTDKLWINKRGGELSKSIVGLVIKDLVEKAELKGRINSHTFRRTCATHMLRHGADPMTVASMLGHADLGTLQHYLQVNLKDIVKTHSESKPGR